MAHATSTDPALAGQLLTVITGFDPAEQLEILWAADEHAGWTASMYFVYRNKNRALFEQFLSVLRKFSPDNLSRVFYPVPGGWDLLAAADHAVRYGNGDPYILRQLRILDPRFSTSLVGQKFSQLPKELQTDALCDAAHALCSTLRAMDERGILKPLMDEVERWITDQPSLSLKILEGANNRFREVDEFFNASYGLRAVLLRRSSATDCGPAVPNRGLEILDNLERWLAAQDPLPEMLHRATIVVEEAQAHTDTCVDALRTGVEGLAMGVSLLQMGSSSDAPLAEKIDIQVESWLADVRNAALGELGEMARRNGGDTREILEVGLLFGNLHRMMAGRPNPGMRYLVCAKDTLDQLNVMLIPGLEDPSFTPYPNLGILWDHYRANYAAQLAQLERLLPLEWDSPTEEDPTRKLSISYGDIEPMAILGLHAIEKAKRGNPPITRDEEGTVGQLVGDVKRISVADLPGTTDCLGKKRDVRREFAELVSCIGANAKEKLVVLAKELLPGFDSLDESAKVEILAEKPGILAQLREKLARVETGPTSVDFGTLSEMSGTLDIGEILQSDASMYQRLGEVLSPEFGLSLQRAIIQDEIDEYLAQFVV
jgi:hypothetical protein